MGATSTVLDRSILMDVRPLCHVDENDTGFDEQLIPIINGQMMMAHQFGIGHNGFFITGTAETWRHWLGDNGDKLLAVKTWLGYTTRMLFDPPTGAMKDVLQHQIDKFETMLCYKSEREGYIKEYVPEKAYYYESIAEATADED